MWSACGSCASGFRVNISWACEECHDSPTTYDWMYLSFMVLVGMFIIVVHVSNIYFMNHIFFKLIILGLLAQWYSINIFSPTAQFSFKTVSVHISALVETVLSAIIALLVSQPVGSLSLKSCAVVQVFNHRNHIL